MHNAHYTDRITTRRRFLSNGEKHKRLRRINNYGFLRKMNGKIKGGVKETRMGRKREKGKRKGKRKRKI
jgi:hypothetical protein